MVVFVTGLPGSGKSTVGRLLAAELGFTFVEMDQFLTLEMRQAVTHGGVLPQTELDDWLLHRALPAIKMHSDDLVVAGLLGGPQYIERFQQELPKCIFINLDAPLAVLIERLKDRVHVVNEESLRLGWEQRKLLMGPGPIVDASQPLETVLTNCVQLAKTLQSSQSLPLNS